MVSLILMHIHIDACMGSGIKIHRGVSKLNTEPKLQRTVGDSGFPTKSEIYDLGSMVLLVGYST